MEMRAVRFLFAALSNKSKFTYLAININNNSNESIRNNLQILQRLMCNVFVVSQLKANISRSVIIHFYLSFPNAKCHLQERMKEMKKNKTKQNQYGTLKIATIFTATTTNIGSTNTDTD